jgi:hydrogenase-1 operon protein HyaF
MKPIDIPVAVVGPGSQPDEIDDAHMDFMQLPGEMTTFSAPIIPEAEEISGLEEGVNLAKTLLQSLQRYQPGGTIQPIELSTMDAKNREFVNGLLGDGEVSIQCNGDMNALIQESVLAGVWRVQYVDDHQQIIRDTIEVADIPSLVSDLTFYEAANTVSVDRMTVPESVYNAPSLLAEIADKLPTFKADNEPHVINLSLLPHTEEDIQYLSDSLGIGPIVILSRGYGNCRVSSTGTNRVWWVQYFNSQDTLILNTLEISQVPKVACASIEDIEDSAERLEEILSIYA